MWQKGHGTFIKFKVDPETVCQYTGLTDNGNKKWEGDIFEASDGDYVQRYVIQWNESELQWYAVCPYDSENNLPLCEFRVKEIDVIGDIFDNPDLLTTTSTDSEEGAGVNGKSDFSYRYA